MHRALLTICIAFLFAIAILHAFALSYDLYWYYPLLNRLIHFVGGSTIALGTVWFFTYRGYRLSFARVLALVLAVSIGWEIFEVVIGMTHEKNYVVDTALDLAMDISGGIVGFFVAARMVQSENNEKDEARAS